MAAVSATSEKLVTIEALLGSYPVSSLGILQATIIFTRNTALTVVVNCLTVLLYYWQDLQLGIMPSQLKPLYLGMSVSTPKCYCGLGMSIPEGMAIV